MTLAEFEAIPARDQLLLLQGLLHNPAWQAVQAMMDARSQGASREVFRPGDQHELPARVARAGAWSDCVELVPRYVRMLKGKLMLDGQK